MESKRGALTKVVANSSVHDPEFKDRAATKMARNLSIAKRDED